MGIEWNKNYWDELSKKDNLRAVLDPNDTHGSKNLQLNYVHRCALEGLLQAIFGQLHISRFESVLDFGCGIGRNHDLLVRYAHKYTGVDVSEGVLQKARQSIEADFRLINDYVLPFEDNCFDLFFSFWVLQHIVYDDDLLRIVKEAHRILSTSGVAIICERSEKEKTEPGTDSRYINRRSPREYVRLFDDAGFRLLLARKLLK
jgi:SAM-dependent methyltransferase